MKWKEQLARLIREGFDRAPEECGGQQLYQTLLALTRKLAQDRPAPKIERVVRRNFCRAVWRPAIHRQQALSAV